MDEEVRKASMHSSSLFFFVILYIIIERFWDQYFPGGSYDAVQRRKSDATTLVNASRPSATNKAGSKTAFGRGSISDAGVPKSARSKTAGRAAAAAGPHRNEMNTEYQKMTKELTDQVLELKVTVEQIEAEREFYFNKLRELEVYVQNRVDAGLSKHLEATFHEIQGILYKVKDES